MKMKKTFMMRTKIIVAFIILAICIMFLLYAGYTTAATIINEAQLLYLP